MFIYWASGVIAVDSTVDKADMFPAPFPPFLSELSPSLWFGSLVLLSWFSLILYLQHLSITHANRIVRTALGGKLPCFYLEKLLLNFSRDMSSTSTRRQKSSRLSSDHESVPESATQPCVQERRIHQEKQRWKDTDSTETFWTVIRTPWVWGRVQRSHDPEKLLT